MGQCRGVWWSKSRRFCKQTMKTISLRPIEPQRDFAQIASLLTVEQDEPTTEPALNVDYESHKDHILCLTAAADENGNLLGFNWATRSRFETSELYLYLIVKPNQRRLGAGRLLYEDVVQAASKAGIKKMKVGVRDDPPSCRTFAEQRGFIVQRYSMAMALNLEMFDDEPYNEIIARLKSEGFEFTSMAALGNTEEAQRKLYALNDMTASETPGSEGSHPWLSFEDFQKSVCQADWYKPDGQMIAINTSNREWAGMSAITRFAGADYAYNLHTGVDKRYRGRKLGQALKIHALRYARDILKAKRVQTNHNAVNDPMIAIDRKFGYVQIPGYYAMEKNL